jgi:hypothetical protein
MSCAQKVMNAMCTESNGCHTESNGCYNETNVVEPMLNPRRHINKTTYAQ